MNIWQAVTWDVARAGGFTAYVLLTLAVAIGLALTAQLQSPSRWPRILNNELHNFLTLLALVFTGVHVLAVLVDPFTHFGWNEVFIPFVSHYRSMWMALGIIALYLGIAIGISTWVRPLIGYTWWRRLHVLTLGIYALVTVHGIATGSDTQTWWGLGIYTASVALVGGLLCRRLLVPVNERGRPHPVIATLVGLAVLVGMICTAAGPLRPGWNAFANGISSGTNLSEVIAPSTSSSSTSSDPFAAPFTAALQGTMAQSGPDANGAETLRVNTTLSNGAQGVLTIVLQARQDSFDDGERGLSITSSQVTLGKDATASLYQGHLTALQGDDYRWRMIGLLAKDGTTAVQVGIRIEMQVDTSGQVTGEIQGAPVQGSPAFPGAQQV